MGGASKACEARMGDACTSACCRLVIEWQRASFNLLGLVAMKSDLNKFDGLPNEAMVPIKTFAAMIDAGTSTIWRRCKEESESGFPQPVRLGARCTRFSVGSIRKFIAARAAA